MFELDTPVAPPPAVSFTSSRELYPEADGEGLPLIRIATSLCRAVIAPQGAQLLEFKTAAGTPLLWLSPRCRFTPGKALRGGIPLCLPWFGPHPSDSSKPQHGFARTSDWNLTQVSQADDGHCELRFELHHQPDDRCSQAFTADLRMVLGNSIDLELSITNRDERDFNCTWALHSYFPVPSQAEVTVPVLAGRNYLDNLENHARKHQDGPLTFSGEVDRVFPAIDSPVVIEGQPRVRIDQEQCPSVVAWNPGPEKAAKMADVGLGNQEGFICIERGAVLDEGWRLAPGEKRSGRLVIKAI